mgnify:CR=1 FL=1
MIVLKKSVALKARRKLVWLHTKCQRSMGFFIRGGRMVLKIIGEVSLRKNMKCDCAENFFSSFEKCHELLEQARSREEQGLHLLNSIEQGVAALAKHILNDHAIQKDSEDRK